jgi:hypothetical protein
MTFALGAVALALSGCLGSEDSSPREDRLAELGLVSGPPANLIEQCKKLARETSLTVYCPPIVPDGPVEVQAHGTAAEADWYILGLESKSLADRREAKQDNPDFPRLRDGPRWSPYLARHWVVAGTRRWRSLAGSVDRRVQYPNARSHFGQRRNSIIVKGVRATVITGSTAGASFESSEHVIVYWRIGNAGYLASVHYGYHEQVAKEIARGLIRQMVDCAGGLKGDQPNVCQWVVAAR